MKSHLNKGLFCLLIFTTVFGGLVLLGPKQKLEPVVQRIRYSDLVANTPPPAAPKIKVPRKAQISNKRPGYQDYNAIVAQIKEWNSEAPDLTEVGSYGKTSRGKEIWYIRVHNKLDKSPKPKVLITASIHGNEPWSTSSSMWYISHMLASYGEDEDITELINTRDIYYIPVVSPDSYPHSRQVDGVDPNRNFPTGRNPNKQSVPPIRALRAFFLKIKPNAVISGHTSGRIFLYPWGDSMEKCPHDKEFRRVMGRFASLCNYNLKRACHMYNRAIFGTEVDWYYRNGAFSCVMEYGTHQSKPSMSNIEGEFNRTYKGVLYFIKEAPLVEINPQVTAIRVAA